ncbi:hypothetical protein V6N13_106048 [Hibiscus sabdariffa]|uniref:Uncharacterized protein n=1 Tax=Hibiscus sabdariffa TaxID=183260 RepID=A0ABR2EZJ6_9ROSI
MNTAENRDNCAKGSQRIDHASIALEILPVALELLFEDCMESYLKFLEAVPCSKEEEKRVLSLIPLSR